MKRFITLVVLLTILLSNSIFAQDNSQPQPAAAPAETNDQDRTILSVDGKQLQAWQIDTMLKMRAGRDNLSAADMWLDMQTKANENR